MRCRATRRRRGFTLIELIVTLTLLSILAGAAAPLVMTQVRGHRIRSPRIRCASS